MSVSCSKLILFSPRFFALFPFFYHHTNDLNFHLFSFQSKLFFHPIYLMTPSSSVYQDLLQLLEMWSLPSTRPRLSWTGAGQRTPAGAGTSPSLSSANAAVVRPLTAVTVATCVASHAGAMFTFCQEPQASTTPRWRWATCSLTLTTPLRSKRWMACHRWHPRWGSTPLSPSPPTKLVRCHNR